MSDINEGLKQFHSTLPAVRAWIENLLEENKDKTTPVSDLDFPTLKQVFPNDFLNKSKVVTVTNKVPFPPLSDFGLQGLEEMENMNMAGITYNDTFFVKQDYSTNESLHFHELVHVVQWERLGIDNFLLAYGIGLLQFGYNDSPFEKVAYSLQSKFDTGDLPPEFITAIQQHAEQFWGGIAHLFN